MVKHLENKEQFFEIISNKVLVDFYADWCGPCKMLAPILENIDSVDILKVNVDSFPDLAAKYGVMSIPTLILFENGKELKKEIGFKNLDEIKKMIEDGRDCSEILIQLSAVKAEIVNTSKLILKDHMDHCIVKAVKENDEEAINHLKTAIDQLL